jgi:uncharacterized protein (TIGR00255 family)
MALKSKPSAPEATTSATLTSMTGHADLSGASGALNWTWEARSVNGRGLDLRLRLPDGFEALDSAIRTAGAAACSRGSVTVSLRLGAGQGGAVPRLNQAALEAVLTAVEEATAAAAARGVDLTPITAAELLGLRGVLEQEQSGPAEDAEVMAAIRAGIEPLFAALALARRQEGAALTEVLGGQLTRMRDLIGEARASAEARAARTGEVLGSRVAALLSARAPVDTERLAQELALLAVKADVSEELDRLDAHVVQAEGLIRGEGPVGRKLDFLMQEFNREANTLCSKAGSTELTAVGLEMKVVIDQMREQVQNVE